METIFRTGSDTDCPLCAGIFYKKTCSGFLKRFRSKNKNRILVYPDRVFNRDHDRNQKMKTGSRFSFSDQDPVEKNKPGSGWEKVTRCT
jgi:hypothetical protein